MGTNNQNPEMPEDTIKEKSTGVTPLARQAARELVDPAVLESQQDMKVVEPPDWLPESEKLLDQIKQIDRPFKPMEKMDPSRSFADLLQSFSDASLPQLEILGDEASQRKAEVKRDENGRPIEVDYPKPTDGKPAIEKATIKYGDDGLPKTLTLTNTDGSTLRLDRDTRSKEQPCIWVIEKRDSQGNEILLNAFDRCKVTINKDGVIDIYAQRPEEVGGKWVHLKLDPDGKRTKSEEDKCGDGTPAKSEGTQPPLERKGDEGKLEAKQESQHEKEIKELARDIVRDLRDAKIASVRESLDSLTQPDDDAARAKLVEVCQKAKELAGKDMPVDVQYTYYDKVTGAIVTSADPPMKRDNNGRPTKEIDTNALRGVTVKCRGVQVWKHSYGDEI